MKPRVATAWLGGCSGCHMSFLDLDERLLELADKIDLVYSPIADIKDFPEHVDVTLVKVQLRIRKMKKRSYHQKKFTPCHSVWRLCNDRKCHRNA